MRALLAALVVLAGTDAQASCRLALVLAMDVSASVDGAEFRQQLDGTAAALDDPELRALILDPSAGHVEMTAYLWSDPGAEKIIVPWVALRTDAAIDVFAATLRRQSDTRIHGKTALGEALRVGHDLLADRMHCDRRVIDVSGDGISNSGRRPDTAFSRLAWDGITVNGLVVGGEEALIRLVPYYETHVIRGPGAFIEQARDYDDYDDAIRRKLFREIQQEMVVGWLR